MMQILLLKIYRLLNPKSYILNKRYLCLILIQCSHFMLGVFCIQKRKAPSRVFILCCCIFFLFIFFFELK